MGKVSDGSIADVDTITMKEKQTTRERRDRIFCTVFFNGIGWMMCARERKSSEVVRIWQLSDVVLFPRRWPRWGGGNVVLKRFG
jgi:hypothetical protein